MINPIFNKSEGRLRCIPRLLIQIAMFFALNQLIHGIVEGAIRACVSKGAATEILACDSAQFIVVFLSFVGSIMFSCIMLDKRPLSDIGVVRDKRSVGDYFFGFALAALLVGTMLAIEILANSAKISSSNFAQISNGRFLLGICDGLVACLMIGFHEELLRFYQIKNLSEGLNGLRGWKNSVAIVIATIFASVFFGGLHYANNGVTPEAVTMLIFDGMFLSLIYILTGRGWLAFGFHAGWDFAEGNIFGFPVSGYPETYSLMKVEQTGSAIITGGTFGPDGGLINSVMIVFGVIGILTWIHWRYKSLNLRLQLCQWKQNEA